MTYLDFPDVVRGDTVKIPITFTVNGAVVDITGWVLYMTVKQFENDPDSEALIIVNVVVHPDPTQGKSIIVLDSVNTSTIAGTFWYDLAYTDLSGNKTTILLGHITFFKNMTTRTSPMPTAPAGVTRIVSMGQTAFTVTTDYFFAAGTTVVYINGLYQSWGIDYTENTNRQGITTTSVIPAGWIVEIRYVPSFN